MEIRTVKCKSGREYKFVNESWSTSRAWGHRTVLMQGNGYNLCENRMTYINRTWEMYTYQSCMSGAVYKLKENELNRYIEAYKYKNDIIRFKKGEKDKVIEEFNNTEIAKDIQDLKNAVDNREFNYFNINKRNIEICSFFIEPI